VAGTVDAVLTFKEFGRMLEEAGIVLDEQPESASDGPQAHIGRSFAISGGLLRTAGLSMDILENAVVITEGKDRVLVALNELARGQSKARLFDVLFCEGCINGPKMLTELSVFARKEVVASYVNEQSRHMTKRELAEGLGEFEHLDLSRNFTRQNLILPEPTEEQIAQALRTMKKLAPEDQLNCGACGYPSCREKAIAVCQGLAESEMCLPYLVGELEATCARLQESHQELASAQQRLVQSERLASMGQLSAAVAHEINNPLGTILLYSHMLLKQLQDKEGEQRDLRMIVNEATRCKDIVRGLLGFARQSRVSKAPTNMAALIEETMSIAAARAAAAGVRLTADVQPGLPTMMIDATQIRQMLVNLVDNAIDAISNTGEVRIGARASAKGDMVEIKVTDNGCGISRENLSKLFTPFFTTKEAGKGTGLGLAIAYGIVKMHYGDISAQSEVGKGTTFTIVLPVSVPEKGEEAPLPLATLGADRGQEGRTSVT